MREPTMTVVLVRLSIGISGPRVGSEQQSGCHQVVVLRAEIQSSEISAGGQHGNHGESDTRRVTGLDIDPPRSLAGYGDSHRDQLRVPHPSRVVSRPARGTGWGCPWSGRRTAAATLEALQGPEPPSRRESPDAARPPQRVVLSRARSSA